MKNVPSFTHSLPFFTARRLFSLMLMTLIILIAACQTTEHPLDNIQMTETPYEFNLPEGVPIPHIPTDKAVTLERVALGRKLFYDTRLSLDSTVACVSCHFQSEGFADHNPISIGIHGRLGFRNSPTLANVAYHPYFFKEGGSPSLEAQAFGPIEEPSEMDFSAAGIVERLQSDMEIQQMSHQAFGRDFDNFVLVNSLGAFQRTLISANSRYDQFTRTNDTTILSTSEKNGMALFFSNRLPCTNCHYGFDFTNYSIVNNGMYATYEDEGLFRITGQDGDIGKFKVPTLRNIALTYPYMHNGAYPTLESVIERYNLGGFQHPNQDEAIQPLHLSEQEQSDLIAFLKTLTDDTFITDERFARPE